MASDVDGLQVSNNIQIPSELFLDIYKFMTLYAANNGVHMRDGIEHANKILSAMNAKIERLRARQEYYVREIISKGDGHGD